MEVEEFSPIEPGYACLYDYDQEDLDNGFRLTIKVPEGFDWRTVKDVSQNEHDVCFSVPNKVPIVCGHFQMPLQSKTIVFNEKLGAIQIEFLFENKVESKFMFNVPNQENHLFDPLSAFIFYSVLSKTDNEELKELAQTMFHFSCEMHFPLALVLAAESLLTEGNKEEGINKLMIAIENGSKVAALDLAVVLINEQPPSYKEAFQYFNIASGDPNLMLAKSYLGLYYSPLSAYEYSGKDPGKAVELFEKVLSKDENDAISLYGLSQLLYKGIGVKEDRNRAIELNNRLKVLGYDIPLQKVGRIWWNYIAIVMGGVLIGAVCGIAYYGFKKITKQKYIKNKPHKSNISSIPIYPYRVYAIDIEKVCK